MANENTPDSSQPSNLEQRFSQLQANSEFRRIDGSETIPVDKLPIFIQLGHETLNTLAVINPNTDLLSEEQSYSDTLGRNQRALNPNVETMIIDPTDYSLQHGTGYKALRDTEQVTFGRSVQETADRFKPFSPTVSRKHAVITKSADGKSITIHDLDSSNGTYIGTSPNSVSTIEPTSEELAQPTQPESSVEVEPRLVESAFASSRASEKHPDSNEDAFLIDKANGLYGVFDGVGGYEGGDIASRTARDTIAHAEQPIDFYNLKEAGAYLEQTLIDANDAVLDTIDGAATTAVLAKIHELKGKRFASIAHTGDSRAYRYRDGVLRALTTDHTPYRTEGHTIEAMAQQERLANTDNINVLSKEDAEAFKHRNVIGASLGFDRHTQIDIKHIAIEPGDAIFLTSDGIHDNLTTTEMQALLASATPDTFADKLTIAAQNRARQTGHYRAKMDDITAIAINI